MERMSIQELAAVLTEKGGLTKREAEQFVTTMFGVVQDGLSRESLVKVKGLGTFKIIDVGARESVNVNTGERVMIESHGKVTFTPDTTLRDLINKPFSQFETVVLNDGVDFSEMPDDLTEYEAGQEQEPVAPVVEQAPEPIAEVAAPVVEVPESVVEVTEPIVGVAEPVITVVEPVMEVPEEPTIEVPEESAVAEEEPAAAAETPVVEEVPDVVEETAVVAEVPVVEEVPSMEEPAAGTEPALVEVPDEVEPEPLDEEEPEVPDVEEPEEETDEEQYDDEQEESQRSFGWLWWLLLALAACGLSFYLGYLYGRSSMAPAAPEAPAPVESKAVAQPDSVADTLQVADVPAQPEEAAPVAPTAPVVTTPVEPDKYEQMDARIRTGAYRIVGTDHVEKARPGDNLTRIAKRTLGADMVCYISAYNGLTDNAELTEGQDIKIPKVVTKKRLREQKKQE